MLADPSARRARASASRAVAAPPGPRQGPPGRACCSPTFTSSSRTRCGTRPSSSSTAWFSDDRSLLDLYTADYTFVNERLGKHYGIAGVTGEAFRRVEYPDDTRRGLLGHGSILTLTSHAGRTSPVLRGKWVMEVLLGTPPPPPPPGVPPLEETEARRTAACSRPASAWNSTGRTRRAIPAIASSTPSASRSTTSTSRASWRIRDDAQPAGHAGELYDGTAVNSPPDLRAGAAERARSRSFRTFTENLMAYALGRRVEYFDQPTVRASCGRQRTDGYRHVVVHSWAS